MLPTEQSNTFVYPCSQIKKVMLSTNKLWDLQIPD